MKRGLAEGRNGLRLVANTPGLLVLALLGDLLRLLKERLRAGDVVDAVFVVPGMMYIEVFGLESPDRGVVRLRDEESTHLGAARRGIDAKARKDLRDWLRRIHDELHVTTVLVTHDQEEALDVADRVAILNHGLIEQFGNTASDLRPSR